MASLIMKVLRDKSIARSGVRQLQKQQMDDIKKESVYAYILKEEFENKLDMFFDDDDVTNVHIVVPEKYLTIFLIVIFRDEFAEYKITQIKDREFEISRKEIYL